MERAENYFKSYKGSVEFTVFRPFRLLDLKGKIKRKIA